MMKKETELTCLCIASLIFSGASFAISINANVKTNHNEPKSIQWKALKEEYLGTDYYYERTFFERVSQKSDSEGKQYTFYEGSYSVYENYTYENVYEPRGYYIKGIQYDNDKITWRL